VRTVDDVLAARESGRLGVFFDIEGANGIADQLSLIELYYDLGVRWMLVAYNLNNRAGGGCLDEDPGLSDFGGRMIDEMNRVGMMLCCSHTGERTALEAIERSADPVIFPIRIRVRSGIIHATSAIASSAPAPKKAAWSALTVSGISSARVAI